MDLVWIFAIFGFLKSFKPSTPFITPFLHKKQFEIEEIVNKVYPVSTLFYMTLLPFTCVYAQRMGYRNMIIFEGFILLLINIFAPFIPNRGWFWIYLWEAMHGLSSACSVSYFTYLYIACDKEKFKSGTVITRSSLLVGHLSASLFGQFLVSKFQTSFENLFFITSGVMLAAFIISWFLPNDRLFNKNSNIPLYVVFRSFTKQLTLWSIYYIVVWLTFSSVMKYGTAIWLNIDQELGKRDNGSIMFISRFFGALSANLPSILGINSFMAVMSGICLTISVLMQTMFSSLEPLYVLYSGNFEFFKFLNPTPIYVFYTLAIASGHFLNAVISVNIANCIKNDAFSLIFGFNMFVSLLLQNFTNLICALFELDLNTRFRILSVIFI